MVQGGQTLCCQTLERFHLGHQGTQQQRFEQPSVVAQAFGRGGIGLAEFDGLHRHVVLTFQHGQQALVEQALGIVKMQPHALRKRLVAFTDRVVQITYRDELAQLQVIAAVHQQLHHQLERRALALERCRYRNQGLHQGR